eukprot:673217-Hanusia_phi.AAC.1
MMAASVPVIKANQQQSMKIKVTMPQENYSVATSHDERSFKLAECGKQLRSGVLEKKIAGT